MHYHIEFWFKTAGCIATAFCVSCEPATDKPSAAVGRCMSSPYQALIQSFKAINGAQAPFVAGISGHRDLRGGGRIAAWNETQKSVTESVHRRASAWNFVTVQPWNVFFWNFFLEFESKESFGRLNGRGKLLHR